MRRPFTLDTIFNDVHDDTANSLRSELTDSSGNVIGSHLSSDGDYHLGVSIEQNVIADDNNSSTTNLASGATFTGTATSTLGVVGLQWSLKTDQNCTVYIEESPDETNWDISYSFDYIATKGGRGGTVQATQAYWRIRVTNAGASTTTYLRLQGVLCPIATPLPSALSSDGRLKTQCSSYDAVTDIQGKITPFGRLKIATAVRMVGTSFSGTTKDTNFWTETINGTGSVTQAGDITLATGTDSDGSAKYVSTRKARHVAGTANEFKFTGRLATVPEADNVRRCGVYNGTSGVDGDGFFFQVDGTTFGVGVRKGGTDTIVESGSFNGDYGSDLAMSTVMGNFVIWWWERVVYFFVNGKLLHKINASTTSLVNTNTLPITMENYNDGSTTNNSFEILVASIVRFGQLLTNPKSYYHATGQTAGVNLKLGAGAIHGVIISNVTNNSVITLSDSTTTTTPTLWAITSAAQSQPTSIDMAGMPFNNGLRLTVATANASVVVIYE